LYQERFNKDYSTYCDKRDDALIPIFRKSGAVWESKKRFSAHTQEKRSSMGTEEEFQCPYSGKGEQYGNREGVSVPILRKSGAVWEPRRRFSAHTQEKWSSMGIERAFQCPYSGKAERYGNREGVSVPILRKSGAVWESRGRINAHTREKKSSMGNKEKRGSLICRVTCKPHDKGTFAQK
jgi:hypothetical protein